jgi:hypothetical protein
LLRSGTLLRYWALLHLALSRRPLRRPLLRPLSTTTFGAISAGLFAAGGQSLAKGSACSTRGASTSETSKRFASPTFLQPLASFR